MEANHEGYTVFDNPTMRDTPYGSFDKPTMMSTLYGSFDKPTMGTH